MILWQILKSKFYWEDFKNLGISAVSLGIINAISGIIGAKVFASEE